MRGRNSSTGADAGLFKHFLYGMGVRKRVRRWEKMADLKICFQWGFPV